MGSLHESRIITQSECPILSDNSPRARARHCEEIAPDAIRYGLHQAESGIRRDRGVDRVPATLENVETDLGGERDARTNHAVTREHFRPRGERSTGNPIDLGDEG